MAKSSVILPDDDDDDDDHHLYLQKSDYETRARARARSRQFSRQNLDNKRKSKSIIEDGSSDGDGESSYKRNKSWNESGESRCKNVFNYEQQSCSSKRQQLHGETLNTTRHNTTRRNTTRHMGESSYKLTPSSNHKPRKTTESSNTTTPLSSSSYNRPLKASYTNRRTLSSSSSNSRTPLSSYNPTPQNLYTRTPRLSYTRTPPSNSRTSSKPYMCTRSHRLAPSSNHKQQKSSYVVCKICFGNKQKNEMFKVQNCSHSFCSGCISKYISVKLQENVAAMTCPTLGCNGALEYDACKVVIPKIVADRWDKVLTESLIPDTEKFYCPFKDCSALMILQAGTEVIREAECMVCHRLFCAQCRSPWHFGRRCSGKEQEDTMFKKLAKRKNWAVCPQCKFYVERTSGCAHMVCRCNYEFCYLCGSQWSLLHPCSRTIPLH